MNRPWFLARSCTSGQQRLNQKAPLTYETHCKSSGQLLFQILVVIFSELYILFVGMFFRFFFRNFPLFTQLSNGTTIFTKLVVCYCFTMYFIVGSFSHFRTPRILVAL